jgi:hypothetical protein
MRAWNTSREVLDSRWCGESLMLLLLLLLLLLYSNDNNMHMPKNMKMAIPCDDHTTRDDVVIIPLVLIDISEKDGDIIETFSIPACDGWPVH